MKNIVLLTAATAIAMTSGLAGAVTLTNHDKDIAKVLVQIDSKKEHINLKSGETFDSKGKDAIFTIASEKPVEAKGAETLVLMGGKITPASKPAEAAPAAGSVVPEKVENKPVESTPAAPVEEGKK